MKHMIRDIGKILLAAVMGGGISVSCVFLLRNLPKGSDDYGIWLVLLILCLAGLILSIWQLYAQGTSKRLRQDIDWMSRTLSDSMDNYARIPSDGTISPELEELHEQICALSSSLRKNQTDCRRWEKQFRYVFSSLNEGFLLLDLRQNIISCNRVVKQVLDLPPNAERQKLTEAVSDSVILEAIRKVLETGEETVFDYTTESENIYAVQIRMVKPDDEQEQSGVLVLMLDVTTERSALRQRQDFFSNASHELRTPITSILGFAEMLESGLIADEDKRAESIRIIRREAQRMSRIINDLLFISKLENDREDLEIQPVNAREMAVEIQETLMPVMQAKNIRMEVSGGNFLVAMPYSHLYNLLANLMQNAVKYNVEGGSVWVRIETDDEKLRIGVRDTGIGIPYDMKSRVFERFFRVDKGRSRNIGGTGLGLSIVKHLASLYHGTVTVESSPGKGSFFQVILSCPQISEPIFRKI